MAGYIDSTQLENNTHPQLQHMVDYNLFDQTWSVLKDLALNPNLRSATKLGSASK